jgi:phage shock protein E
MEGAMSRHLLVILCLLSVCVCAPSSRGEEHTQDKIDQVISAIKSKKAVLIDVREKSEWDKGHLKDAKLLPLSALKKDASPEGVRKLIPKESIVYVHCASGYRCLEAAPLLRKMGYEVRALPIGYKDLVKAGLAQAPVDLK